MQGIAIRSLKVRAIDLLLSLVNPLITVAIYIVIPIIYLIPSPIDELVDYAASLD